MMTRSEFVREVARRSNITLKDCKSIISAVEDTIYANIVDGDVRAFDGITFTAVEQAARQSRNPKTGEVVDVAAKMRPKCKFGKKAKEVVNGGIIIEAPPVAE